MTFGAFVKKAVLFVPRRIQRYVLSPCRDMARKCFFGLEKRRLHRGFENAKGVQKLADLEKYRLYKILRFAADHSPYYRAVLPHVTRRTCKQVLESIPLLTRQVLLDEGESIKVDIIERIPHFELSTSGTTGIPLKFVRCPDYEQSHQMFLYEFMTGLRKVDVDKIVSFGGLYLEEESLKKHIFWSERTPHNIYGCCHFSSFYLTKENLEYYIAELERLQPCILRGYPSCLTLFVDLCTETGLRPSVRILGIYVTSESVTKEQLEKLSSFFDCGVHGQYGHSEACVFGFTRANDTVYYCSPLYGYVEVVDDDGRHVQPGEVGKVCVTSFTNKAQPFIRYLTGDLAEYGGRYNGFCRLTKLLGRSQDYVLNADGEKLFIIVGELSECFLPAINNVQYWQAVQDEPGKMLLKIVPKSSYLPKDEEEILVTMQRSKMQVTIEYVDSIPLTKAGKRKYIVQNIEKLEETLRQ